jgi:hypothetical protein
MIQNETERQRKKLKNDKIIPKNNEKKKPDDAQKYLPNNKLLNLTIHIKELYNII